MPVLEIATRWGALPARYPYRKHSPPASRLAVLFPGYAYPLAAPVLHYVAQAAFQAGCDVLGIEYGYQANRADLAIDDIEGVIQEVSASLAQVELDAYSEMVFIGKSIGTVVQGEVARHLRRPVRNHVFLTPLRRVIPTIREAKHALVVVGDRDEAFGRSDVEELKDVFTARVHVVPKGDHGLETGDYQESLDVLKAVSRWCEEFCRDLR